MGKTEKELKQQRYWEMAARQGDMTYQNSLYGLGQANAANMLYGNKPAEDPGHNTLERLEQMQDQVIKIMSDLKHVGTRVVMEGQYREDDKGKFRFIEQPKVKELWTDQNLKRQYFLAFDLLKYIAETIKTVREKYV